jgi:hypothetical protein
MESDYIIFPNSHIRAPVSQFKRHTIHRSLLLSSRHSHRLFPREAFQSPYLTFLPHLIACLHCCFIYNKMASSFLVELLVRDHAPNYTIPTELCTLETCSITQAQLTYDPNLGGNVFFAALFTLLLSLQLILGFYYRTWSFTTGMVGGLILEICGYTGRIQMHYNPFITSPFFMYVPTRFASPL